MIKALAAVGRFLRILDDGNQLSLTNIAVYITLYRLATSPVTNYTDIAALLAAMGTYTVKKVIS
jgi:hypothetical protein